VALREAPQAALSPARQQGRLAVAGRAGEVGTVENDLAGTDLQQQRALLAIESQDPPAAAVVDAGPAVVAVDDDSITRREAPARQLGARARSRAIHVVDALARTGEGLKPLTIR
jgi:hypothetical protein